MELSYIINELAESREDYFRAIAPPLIQTSNFAFKTVDDLTMPQQKAEEKQNQEIRQQLETLLLSNPKLKTDLNLNKQRFFFFFKVN